MSNNEKMIQATTSSLVDCDSNFITTSSSSSSTTINSLLTTMPSLVHNTKRKRLDTVLTKLSMYKSPDETIIESSSNNECKDLLNSNSQESFDMLIKTPKKQLSLDSEMSMTVGNLNLNINSDQTKSKQLDKMGSQECISSTTSSSMFSPSTTTYETTPIAKTTSCHEYSNTNSKEIDSFSNTSSDLLASSMPMSALFTPPTSDSAGGTAEFEEEEEQEDNDDEGTKNYDHEGEVSDTTTVTMASAKYMLDSDNLFGSHDFNTKERLLKRLPQAKLLSHDLVLAFAQKACQNAQVPDTQTRTKTKMAQALISVGVSESVSSTSSHNQCSNAIFKLPFFDTLPSSFPICKCLHCQQNLVNRTNSLQMPSISHHQSSQHSHFWSLNNLKSDTFSSSDSLVSLLSPAPGETQLKCPQVESLKTKKSQQQMLTYIRQLKNEKSSFSTLTDNISDQSKKRSYSDSDVLIDYFNVFKHVNSGYVSQSLPRAESGLILNKNGRSVPKPLQKTLLVQSQHSTPQESPLDLSVKSLNTQLITESEPLKYRNLMTQKTTFTTSCSVPSLTSIVSPKHFQFCSQNAIFRPIQSFKVPNDESQSSYKRQNATSSESFISSISSVSSISPCEKMEQPSKNIFVRDEDILSTPSTSNLKISKRDDPVPGYSTDRLNRVSNYVSCSNEMNTSASVSSLTDIDRKSFTCTICNQTFTLHDRLAKHIASRHKNRQQCDSVAKNYLCEICQRSFARSDMLTRHMRLHTGIKPYTCKICDQVFSRSDHLSTHQRTHTGEKPYKCPQCPYAACRRDMITRHMRTHSRYETPDSSSSTEELSK